MYVIAGVSGNTGAVAAQTLLDAGHPVRVIVRNAEKGKIWQERGAEVAVADLFDKAALANALEGATGVYLLLPPDVTSESFFASRKELADIYAEVAQTSNVPHVVFLSSVGAQHEDKTGPIKTVAYLERAFAKTTVKTTAIRPGYFMENWANVLPVVRNDAILPTMLFPLDKKIDMVATHDIGQAVAKALLNPGIDNKRVIELKGPSQYSALDVAQAFSKVLGRDISAVAVPQDNWVGVFRQVGISQAVSEAFAEMYEHINSDYVTYEEINVQKGNVALDDLLARLVA